MFSICGQSRTKNGGLFIGFATVQEQDNTTLQGTETLGENKCSLVWTAITEFSELGLMFNYFFDPVKYVDTDTYNNMQNGAVVGSKPYGSDERFDMFFVRHVGDKNLGFIVDQDEFLHGIQGQCHNNVGPYGRFKRPMIVEILQFSLLRWKMRKKFTIADAIESISKFSQSIENATQPGPWRLGVNVIPEYDEYGVTSLNGVRFCEEVLWNVGALGGEKYKKFEFSTLLSEKNFMITGCVAGAAGYIVYCFMKPKNETNRDETEKRRSFDEIKKNSGLIKAMAICAAEKIFYLGKDTLKGTLFLAKGTINLMKDSGALVWSAGGGVTAGWCAHRLYKMKYRVSEQELIDKILKNGSGFIAFVVKDDAIREVDKCELGVFFELENDVGNVDFSSGVFKMKQ